MESLLRKPSGQVTVLVVGGAPEALNSDQVVMVMVMVMVMLSLRLICLQGKIKLVLNCRKGFIKLALRFTKIYE